MTNETALAGLRATLDAALRSGDAREASIARVNIACAYLQLGDPNALAAFEDALSSVRRAQNGRSEGILSMAFAPFFVEQGDPGRALELAKRGEELARNGRVGHRVWSHIQLARVFYTGLSDSDEGGQAVDRAVAALDESEIMNETDRQVVTEAAGQAALAAVEAGDTSHAMALMRIVDPEATDRVEQQRPQASAGLTEPEQEELSQLYAEWPSRFGLGKAGNARVAEMTRTTNDLLQWGPARAGRSVSSGVDGVIAFVNRVQQVADGAQTMAAAIAAAPPEISDDDLVFAVGLATDRGFNHLLPGWAVFELVGSQATDRALAGRCFRLAAAIGHQQRPPAETLDLLQRADAALDGGADDLLRTDVVNEIAVAQLNLRQPGPALDSAMHAADLARQTGQDRFERMARGNEANAYLQLQRVRDALQIFEALERDQLAAGEREMAQITRQNIDGCRAYLAQQGEPG